MDLETIKRINRDALRAAQESEGETSEFGKLDNQQLIMYAVAVAIAVGAYFLLQNYKPDFVMSTENGQKKFDQTRAIIASVVVGLVVILCYHFLYKKQV
ncbi:hypothetical protein LCGC14_2215570 [marine sediment metagenome]|uniref:Uncharacterized protein n=2 Tax=root TaxID=1 RepID=A0A0F9DZZ0_9ZZZZ|nr:MAG: hypothetical protein LCMAC202_04850 [Marseillevirus LCMAC202]